DRERSLVVGAYNEFHSTARDRAKALASYLAAYAADSNSAIAANRLMSIYADIGDFEHGDRFARREIAMEASPSTISYRASVLWAKGDSTLALRLTDSLQASNRDLSNNVWFQQVIAISAFARGKIDSVRTIAERMLRANAGVVRFQGATVLVNDATLQGQLSRAHIAMQERAEFTSDGKGANAVADSIDLAYNDIVFRGKNGDALRRLDAVISSPEFALLTAGQRPDLLVAQLYARAGNVPKAKSVLAKFEAANPQFVHGAAVTSWHRARAETALAEKKYADALLEFRASNFESDGLPAFCVSCTEYNLARTFVAANQPDSAITSFERYLAVPAGNRVNGFFARCETCNSEAQSRAALEKKLGELYDAKGDRAKTILHYNTFVQLWKNADPELMPAVETVRKRLTELAIHEGK
ncbi:MAG: hypothetical protein ABJB66_11410, partial [Gemmatimonadaceae bacterium]